MKIFLSPSNQDNNKYAYGNTNEAVVCGQIAQSVKVWLEKAGFEIMLMHDEDMATKVAAADKWGADLYIPIHTNAFNGQVSGTRMFYCTEGGPGQALAKAIFARLAPLTPGTSENIKQNTGLYELKAPRAYGCYIEVDFHDVPDTAKWLMENTENIGKIIAMGVCDYAGVTIPADNPADASSDTLYRVQVGAFRQRSNADALLAKLKVAGYDGFIVTVKK